MHKAASKRTSQEIALQIGVEKSTVDKWSVGEQAAQGSNFFALVQLFGVDFQNDVTSAFGIIGAYHSDSTVTNPFITNAEIAHLLSVLSTALQDGRIDHVERPQVLKQLRAMIGHACSLESNLKNAE